MDRRKIHVGNISYRVSSRDLRMFLSKFGAIGHCSIVKDKVNRSKGYGFVTFRDKESVESALKSVKEELVLDNRVLRLSYCHSEDKKPGNKKITGRKESTNNLVLTSSQESEASKILSNPKSDASSPRVTVCNKEGPLSDDTLLLVFSYLSLEDLLTIEQVCRKWYRLAMIHWRCKTVLEFKNVFSPFSSNGCRSVLTDEVLLKVLHKTDGQLRSLDLSASSKLLTNYAFDKVGIHCPMLQVLNLTQCRLSQNSAKFLSSKLDHLMNLTLKSCTLSEKSLWWFLHNCPALEYLDIEDNRQITGKCFFVSKGKLKTIIMNDCVNVLDEGFQFLTQTNHDLEVVKMNNCNRVTTLTLLSEVSVVLDCRNGVCNETLSVIGRCCQMLRAISLVGCSSITDKGLVELCPCASLCDINVSYCLQVSDYGLSRLSQRGSLTRVVARSCHEISDEGVICLLGHSSNIAEVDVCGCVAVTNRLLVEIGTIVKQFTDEKRRVRLFLGGTQVTIEGVKNLETLTKLYEIMLHDYSQPSLYCDHRELSVALSLLDDQQDDDCLDDKKVDVFSLIDSDDEYDGFLVGEDPAALYSDDFSDPENAH